MTLTDADKELVKWFALETGGDDAWIAEGNVGVKMPQGVRYHLPLDKWKYEGME